MNRVRMERRSFLKAAAQTTMAAPAVSALGRLAEAQQATPAKTAPAAAHPAAHAVAKAPDVVPAPETPYQLHWRPILGRTGDYESKVVRRPAEIHANSRPAALSCLA